jgi:hypothetical protein
MKKLVVFIALALGGCNTMMPAQTIVKTESVVIMPDKSLFYCPNVRRFPNPETLTDVEVAKLLVTLHKNNTECQKNINSIEKFLLEAKVKHETK